MTENGKRVRRFGGHTPQEALEARDRAVAELRGAGGRTIADACMAYLERVKLSGKTESLRTAEIAVRHIQEALGSISLSALSAAHVDRYLGTVLEKRERATAAKYLRYLKAVLRLAHERGELPTLPRIRPLTVPRKIPTTLTPDQVAALLESSGTLRPVLVLILFTALRVGEVAALRWGSVDLKAGSIKLAATPDWQPKAHHERQVAVVGPALEALRSLKPGGLDDFVFKPRGGSRWSAESLGCGVRRIFKLAGVKIPKSGAHCLRRTALTRLLRAGVDLESVRAIAGHASSATTLRAYIGTDEAAQREGLERLAAAWGAK